MRTLHELSTALADGRTTSRTLVEACLARINDPQGEGRRTFVKVDADAARLQADAMDALRRAGRAPGPFAGIPFSIKDLADIAGQPTPAGSAVLAHAEPATAHAPVVSRILDAGFVVMGRTNMVEFAFSGLGINPHYDTPRSPWDRATGRIPGGSSSGAAVSISDQMAYGALGTDTGGSCRVPAAMCGITGYKPTARRVPTAGILPLSTSLDSVGPLANSVACCAAIDAVFAGEPQPDLTPVGVDGLRLAVPLGFVLEGMDTTVAATFERALSTLSAAGARVLPVEMKVLDDIAVANAGGGFAAAEAWAWHRRLLASRGDGYDPRVKSRILRGQSMTAADYLDLLAARADIIARFDAATSAYDAVLLPTCPLIPAPIAALDTDAEYARVNMLQLRNPSIGNFLDRCAISLPCHREGEAPVGLMLMGETLGDAWLFRVAAGVEAALKGK
ncbi:MAG TPA: amidase [Acetobacteraceae bacterium]|jgi:aspartyl-tRNA(Asn)/glutamyl-tRNA(Gln) amidotransferase subunit A|nr:amidase [Acetobacteraceae bacterium]